MDWPHLRDEIVATTAKVGDQLRARPDGDLRLSRVTADLHLSADPVTFLRDAYGLIGNAGPPCPAVSSSGVVGPGWPRGSPGCSPRPDRCAMCGVARATAATPRSAPGPSPAIPLTDAVTASIR
jgi:hypothetical protein